ncbi:MAG: S41 family peptidase [Treponema sp.]|nr:S41 family peptidase [Treponema sp.]
MNNSKLLKKIVFSLSLVFTLLMSSSCFAQSKVYTKNGLPDNKVSNYNYERSIKDVFEFIQQNYVDEVDPKVLYEGALKGMLDSLGDPYTVYLDSDYMRDLNDTTSGSFGGVGLTISKPVESTPEKPAYVLVSTPIEDGPGAKAGIRAGDYIIEINGDSTITMTMNEVLQKLRGKIGESVKVTILRGQNVRFEVELVRALIEVPTAKYGMIENTKIGYIRLIEFTPETANKLQDAVNLFEKNNYNSMIIDLRDNPGGLLTSVVNVADKFIDNGTIVSTRSRLSAQGEVFSASSKKTTVKKDIPIIVLINRGSASASEILAGALKDYHLAYLVGERTYGKGSVQQVLNLSSVDGFKITMARYYTPSDVNIDKIGIPPDREILLFPELSKEEEEKYLELINSGVIEKQCKSNPNMTESEVKVRAYNLSEKYGIEARMIRKLYRNELEKLKDSPLYDLDFDIQLQEAINIINKGDFKSLMKSAKTLKQLQDEVEKDQKEKK